MLRLRFGIEDGHTRTLEEVGKEFNVTRDVSARSRPKALRKLHPSKKLKDFLNWRGLLPGVQGITRTAVNQKSTGRKLVSGAFCLSVQREKGIGAPERREALSCQQLNQPMEQGKVVRARHIFGGTMRSGCHCTPRIGAVACI